MSKVLYAVVVLVIGSQSSFGLAQEFRRGKSVCLMNDLGGGSKTFTFACDGNQESGLRAPLFGASGAVGLQAKSAKILEFLNQGY